MNITELVNDFKKNNSMLWVENEYINLFVSDSLKSQELKDTITKFKSEIVEFLTYNKIFSKEDFQKKIIFSSNVNETLLSFAQERLWFIEQYDGGTSAYHIPIVLELLPHTDAKGVKYALQQIVSRHKVLRSTIKQVEGHSHALQVVQDKPLAIEEVTLSENDDYMTLLMSDINRPFSLSHEYPIRVKLYCITSTKEPDLINRHLLLINMHHIASDGWSMWVLQEELLAYYQAYISGNKAFSLPGLDIQYKDFAVWQRGYVTGEVLEKQISYWCAKLSGYEKLEMPTDFVRPVEVDYKGASEVLTIDKRLSEKLRTLSKTNGTTLHSLLLSSIAILLGKYTGQEDILIGGPIANRHHQQTQGLIGFFVNTLVNRVLLNKTQSYLSLIHEVHKDQIAAQSYQDLPFERLVVEMEIPRDTSRHPIFQVMLVVQGFGNSDKEKNQRQAYFKPFESEGVYEMEKFDLSIVIDDSQQELNGKISYATSLFRGETVRRIIAHFQHLLLQLCETPDQSYSQLSLLSAEEYDRIVYQWNATDKDYPKGKTIHGLFQEQVTLTPDSIALVYEGQTMTYQQLNERSNQLALHIRSQYEARTGEGLAPDTLIALYLDRSLEMIIGILAVLKAGGAYVPIDINYPQERIDFILEDTEAALILSQKHLREGKRVLLPPSKVIHIDLFSDIYSSEDKSNLSQHNKPADLAYAIYTSGTTGKPKGVLLTHKNLSNLVYCQREFLEITPDKKVLQYASLVFDASVWEIFSTLSLGAELFIAPNHARLDANLLCNYLSINKINIATLPPPLLIVMPYRELPELSFLVVAGESCPLEIIQSWNDGRVLINAYGPTESTVCATMHPYAPGDTNINIGNPLGNIKVYVLDSNHIPVPIGVIGELYIGGAGVARGYLKRPELTEERFIPNPFATDLDKANGYDSLYKTGDLVRWLPNGNIEFLGRNDDQVKVRGFRIELGEVEQALLRIPGIRQACVLVRERKGEAGANKYLVGYYVSDKHQTITSEEIESKLGRAIPDYMVPASLVRMETFPLTISGKLDKCALPDPDLTSSSGNYTAPRTDTEAQLSTIWSEVLGLGRVGVTDDFFRIGGDSILSIQVSSRIRQLGLSCQVKDIFEHRTIARLAEHLIKKSVSEDIQIEQGTLTGSFDLLPIQRWFFDRVDEGELPEAHHWNQSFLVKIPEMSVDRLEAALEGLVAHHDMLRVRFIKEYDGRNWRQVYQMSIDKPVINSLDVSKHTETEINEVLTDWQGGFHLGQGPLFQVGYLHGYSDGNARLSFALHHLIVDAVSWRILIEDIKALCQGGVLPMKGSSYRQWVRSVRQYPSEHPQEAIYWKEQLGNTPRWSGSVQAEVASTSAFVELGVELTDLLLHRIATAYRTQINDLLLTALAYSLKAINHSDVQGITLEGHGREDIDKPLDIGRTVGWFTAMFPVRLALQETLGGSIQGVKETLRSIPRKGVGFGAFAISEGSGITYQDLSPIYFNYLGQFESLEGAWQITTEGSGGSVHAANADYSLISINGGVSEGKLKFNVSTRLGQAITHDLAVQFNAALVSIIEHCEGKLGRTGSSSTPSDFAHARLSQRLIDRLEHDARMRQREIQHIYPANSLQQGFIYHALSQGDDDAYRVQLLYDYHQRLDVGKYLEAWGLCIRQYPILRAAFSWDEEVLQVIYKEGELRYQLHDISHLPTQQERDEAVDIIQADDRRQPFDLTQPTPLRLHIIRQRENHYTILKSEHHSIADGWSGPILLTSLNRYYKELIENREIAVREDLAYLQAQEYNLSRREAVGEYWDGVLATLEGANDINPLLSCPIKFGNYRQVGEPGVSTIVINAEAYKELKDFCIREGVTLNVILQFAWHKMLQVYSGSSRSIVGTTISGRDLPVEGVESSVGLYINTLPLIIDWDNENSILAQLNQIQQKLTELSTYSSAYLAKIQKQGERLFQSLFVFENYPIPSGSRHVADISFRKSVEKTDYPFGVLAYEQEEGLTVKLQFDAVHLTREKADEHTATLRYILEEVVNGSRKTHKKLNLLRGEEYEKIVYHWNATDKAYPKDKTIYGLFQEQVTRTPDSIAIVYEGRTMTYQQLNERSNQLARHIRSQYKARTTQELKADTLIALYLERSLEMIIGILAVLKAGGAYLPMDTSYPQERLDYMLEDSGAELILSQKDLNQTKGTALPAHKVLHIDLSNDIYTTEDTSNLPQFSKPTDLAYLIYTSGTTGKPKGVMVEHKGINNLVQNQIQGFGIETGDKAILFASYVFDATVSEVFTVLTKGASLYIIPNNIRHDTNLVSNFIQEQGIKIATLPPVLLSTMSSKTLTELKTLIVAGETCPTEIMETWSEGRKLINAYGPTEGTVCTTMRRYTPGDINTNIGKPLGNIQVYILDPNHTPLPIGITGELYIGGAGVARGYLKRPELNAERFVSNPFATEADRANGYDRLYKTGDLVRWMPSGSIEFIGRNDDQVKIRGYRIELSEIEQAMLQIPGIKQSCVLAKQRKTETDTSKYLVGYYVLDTAHAISSWEITDKLKEVLPDYMIPASLIEMEAIPMTINGKLDKKSLPEVDFALKAEHYLAPHTEVETQICAIWGKVLGQERVGITDDFFHIGGNSILAIQVSHRMSKALGCDIKVADIFKYKTITQLLAHNKWQEQIVIPVTTAVESPLSFAQERLWFIEQYEQGSNAYHIPVVLELTPHTDVQGLKYALQQVVARHEVLRSTIEQRENQRHGLQIAHNDALMIEEITLDADSDYLFILQSEVNRPFNLSKEYPIRVKFFIIEPAQGEGTISRRLLLINMHHIASDGWSMGILQKELLVYYQAYIGYDMAFSLPALEIQYKDFAIWQRGYVTGEVEEKQIAYWRNKLSGFQTLEMPTDFVRLAEVDYKGASERFTLDKELSSKIKTLCQMYGVTLHSLMLSSVAILLGKYTNQEDIVIGSPIANRHYRQTQGLIGFFVNTQVNRVQLDKTQNYRSLVQQVQHDQIAAQQYQDLPFERLVEALDIPRDPSRHPIFQVMFGVQSFGSTDGDENAMKKYYIPLEQIEIYGAEKFDLSIFIDDSQQELNCEVSYATSLFQRETIRRIIAHYQHLLSRLCEIPEQSYSQLLLLSAEEYEQIVYHWNETDRDYPKDKTIHQMFELQVARIPESIAIVYEGQTLTYRELNEKSNQLARYIRAQYKARTTQELKADTFIALCLDRSLEMIIGIQAVLKAGGAYVPMDISYPQERIDYMLADSGAEIILSQKHVSHSKETSLPAHKVLHIDLTEDIYGTEDESNLPSHSQPANLAYVIYTSGTTGKPKGVMIEHGGVVNLMIDLQSKYCLSSDERFIMLANYIFDASVEQLFIPLLSGGVLFIPDNNTILESSKIENFIKQNKITHIDSTPSYINSIDPSNLSSLRRVAVGAEYLPKQLFDRYKANIPTVINEYGPTETTIVALISIDSYLLNKATIQNTRAYILDTNHLPIPIGVVGELYIGGAGLARGYLNQPELTAERFIPNLFATENDKLNNYNRLYKTGDLMRWLPDGKVEFIGRNDDQIKIRGFRVELGEIEKAMLQIPGIKQSCVLAKERKTNTGSTKYLIGWYVLDKSAHDENQLAELSAIEIKNSLLKELPEYMVPSYFVPLSKLPLNVNGKIDRKALPEPEENTMNGKVYEAPRNEIEETLCKIWQDILGIERVGINDNFFELGGHSILAMNLVSVIKNTFNIEVPLNLLFRKPRISELSIYIVNSELYLGEMLHGNKVYLLNNDGKKIIFAFPPIIGYGIVFKLMSHHIKDFSLYVFDFIEDENRLSMYVDMILSIQKEGPYILMGYSAGGNLAYEVAFEMCARGYEVSDIIMVDSLRKNEIYDKDENNDQNTNQIAEVFKKDYLGYIENPMDSDFIFKNAVQQSNKYSNYFSKMINDKKVRSNIHLILSENNNDENRLYDWELVSEGVVKKYQGKGHHDKMISSSEELKKNAAIINKILNSLTLKIDEIEYQLEEGHN